jgi:hypothetical protein
MHLVVRIYIYKYTHTYTYTYMHAYIHTHTHIHTFIHTYIHTHILRASDNEDFYGALNRRVMKKVEVKVYKQPSLLSIFNFTKRIR